MKVYEYENYDDYVDAQVEANKKKITNIWIKEDSVLLIKDFVRHNLSGPLRMLCHGTRNGGELKMFSKHLDLSEIIGTEISPTAKDYENTIQHDFHDVKEEWKGHFDLVYSNSLDHSYEPDKAVRVWLDQLSDDGVLIIEWTGQNHKTRRSDPFSATLDEFRKFMNLFAHLILEKEVPLRVAKRKYQTLLFFKKRASK